MAELVWTLPSRYATGLLMLFSIARPGGGRHRKDSEHSEELAPDLRDILEGNIMSMSRVIQSAYLLQ